MKDIFVGNGFGKSWGYLLLFSDILSLPDNGYMSDLRTFSNWFE